MSTASATVRLRLAAIICLVFLALPASRAAYANIADTKHNLSASGPGTVKAAETQEVCIFCHTPHNANPSQSLWNPRLPGATYVLYTSSTLEAQLNQPTGSSRLCLACHDGTLALGALQVPPAGGAVSLPHLSGGASLSTDLSDDHPISFVYDSALVAKNSQLADPAALPQGIRLDKTQQVQCTACHDPHSASFRKFLRVDDRSGALCTACHKVKNWAGSSHATSTAAWSGSGTNPWPASAGYTTVGENGCENCHQPHAAPEPARLLSSAQDSAVCMKCHNGSVASKNLEPELLKPYAHPVNSSNGLHEPRENFTLMPRHATCVDCHNPHQAEPAPAPAPNVPGRLKGVSGVDISGAPVSEARYEYEVCFKCHSTAREDFNPGNASYHPVAAVGKNPGVSSLLPGYTPSSLIGCTDCHNNDEWASGGSQPKGPHGSRFYPLLERRYWDGGIASYSTDLYALCYKCHMEMGRFSGTGAFPHTLHVGEVGASCGVCHAPHGSRDNKGLIKFNPGMVSANDSGVFAYWINGGHGQCALKCHDYSHEDAVY